MSLIDLKLGQDGDLEIKDFDLQIVKGVDSVAQNIKQRLRLFQGEWFLDELAGVPYFQTVFRKGVALSLIRSELLSVVAATPFLKEVTRFDVEPLPNRGLQVDFAGAYDSTGEPLAFSIAV